MPNGVSRETVRSAVSRETTRAFIPSISGETQARLDRFLALLLQWNAAINLVSRRDTERVLQRHVEDALQLIPLLPPGCLRGIDVGSGGGFPGLVLAIATDIRFDLVDADKRKAAFLRQAARVAGADAYVHAERIESVCLPPAELMTARAFAPLDRLLNLSHRLLAPGAVLLLPKGETVDQELGEAQANWSMRVEKFASATDAGGTILRLSEVMSCRS